MIHHVAGLISDLVFYRITSGTCLLFTDVFDKFDKIHTCRQRPYDAWLVRADQSVVELTGLLCCCYCQR